MLIKITRPIEIPSTVAWWELYDEKGASFAAHAIARKLGELVHRGAQRDEATIEMHKFMCSPALARFGAADGEPLRKLATALDAIYGEE